MVKSPSVALSEGRSQRLLREHRVMLIVATCCALAAPLLHLVDATLVAALANLPVRTTAWFQELFGAVRPFGHGEVVVLIAFALGAIGRRKASVDALLALVLVAVVVWITKISVERIRPNGDHYSFPSGDAATCAVLIPLFWYHVRAHAGWWASVAGILTLAVAAGRVFKEYHYPADVAAGCAIGVLCGIIAHAALRRVRIPLSSRWFVAAFVATFIGCVIGYQIKLSKGDFAPLFPPFMLTFLPIIGLLVATPWVRTWRGAISQRPLVLLVMAVGLASVLAFGATRSSLWDRDETFYAQTAQEMLLTGNWLVPTFNGEPFLHKPPLIYWLMSGSIALAGPQPWAFRIWSCLALVGILTGLGWLTQRLIGRDQGPRTVLVFGTMPLMLVVGGAATTDAVLLLCITIAMLPWLGALTNPTAITTSSWTRALLMGLGMGVGMLTKAPLGIAVPAASLACAWWLVRRAHQRAPLSIAPPPPLVRDLTIGVLVALGIYLTWAIPTNIVTHGALWDIGIGRHIVGRALAPMESHGGPLWRSFPYYALVTIGMCLPWTAYLPALLSALSGGRLGDHRLRITIIAWFVPTFVLMTCVATKLPHYIVPALPGLAFGVVATIAAAENGQLHARDLRWLRVGRWLLTGLFVPLGTALVIAPWILPLDDPRSEGEALATLFKVRHAAVGVGLLFISIPGLIWRPWVTQPLIAARLLALGMIAIALSAAAFLMPTLEAFKPSPTIGAVIHATTADEVPVATAGYDEPSLLVAINRSPLPDVSSPEQLRTWATRSEPGVLVATSDALAAAGVAAGQPGLTLLDHRRGYNYSRGKWLELITLGRNLPPVHLDSPASH